MDHQKPEIVNSVTELWQEFPDMRFCQLILFIGRDAAADGAHENPYDLSDKEFLEACQRMLQRRRENPHN